MEAASISVLPMKVCCHRRNAHPERARATTPLWLSFFASYFPIIPACNVSDVPLFPSHNSPTPTSPPMSARVVFASLVFLLSLPYTQAAENPMLSSTPSPGASLVSPEDIHCEVFLYAPNS